MIPSEERKIIENISEFDLANEILIPLFQKMGFRRVEFLHGPYEMGRDFHLTINDPFGHEVHFSVIIKSGKVPIQVIREIYGFMQMSEIETSRIIIIATKGITNSAQEFIKSVRNFDISIIDSIALQDLINKHFPKDYLNTVQENKNKVKKENDRKNVFSTLLINYQELHKETDSNKKGKLLEDLISNLFEQIEDFQIIQRMRTTTEEIDIVIRNESNDKFWEQQGLYILIECKNWSKKIGKDEIVLFRDKLSNRFQRCNLGFLISINGFYQTIDKVNLRSSKGELLVVPISGDMIIEMIKSSNPSNKLKSYIE